MMLQFLRSGPQALSPALRLSRGLLSNQGALSSTAPITLGDNDKLGAAELAARLDGTTVTKMNGAGSTVVVSLASGRGRAIVFADVAWRGNAINRILYFPT